MKKANKSNYEEECEAIGQERETYQESQNSKTGIKVFDWLSTIFLMAGFVALALVPFTEITLLQATCLFVIHYTIAPTDFDYARWLLKGLAEDMAHIRANLTLIRKGCEKQKKQ